MYLKDSEKVVSISSEHLEPITPTKNNKVMRGQETWGPGAADAEPDPVSLHPGEGDPG